VAALNRAVASAEVQGPQAALAAIEQLAGEPRLQEYQPFWAARAHLLARCGRGEDAAQAYQRAIGLERDDAVRRFLQRRAERDTR
jgi:RNA polymerase sigma-70 factor (ECF subfamily)